MPPITSPAREAKWLLSVAPGDYSYDEVTIDAGDLVSGAVLGQITSGGKWIQCDPAALDGSEVAKAVLLLNTDASAADQVATIVARIAEVDQRDLDFGTMDAGEIAAAVVELAAVGIVCRTQ